MRHYGRLTVSALTTEDGSEWMWTLPLRGADFLPDGLMQMGRLGTLLLRKKSGRLFMENLSQRSETLSATLSRGAFQLARLVFILPSESIILMDARFPLQRLSIYDGYWPTTSSGLLTIYTVPLTLASDMSRECCLTIRSLKRVSSLERVRGVTSPQPTPADGE